MVRNINVCNKHVKKHKKEYIKPLRALREGLYVKAETINPAHKDAFNSLISDFRKKNPYWDRESVDDHGSTTRALFTEEITDEEI